MAARSERIILASASPARAALLTAAGVEFTIMPAGVDEARIKREARRAGDSAVECAVVLATEKARLVSERYPEALVVGADQILEAGGEWFDKPMRWAQLESLRDRGHSLATAACVACAGIPLWRASSAPELRMRRFSDAFLDAYLAAEGESLLGSVGAYRLEGRGVQLFARISGDHFAVLGLPLIGLLAFLRERGAVLT